MLKSRPSVDIIIPFHGQYESVTRCVGSVFACTPNQDYKIILVDDASKNPAYLKSMIQGRKKVTGVRLDEQTGFGGALKAGFNAGKSPYVVFLHSDVWTENAYWLANLQRALNRLKSDGVKLVSARSDNPGTSFSHDPRMFGSQNENAVDAVVNSACPLLCALCHRELFSRIGGFVKPYPYAWYEDEELFWRMQHHGYKQAVVAGSYVRHGGGLTVQEVWGRPKVRPTMENNRDLCLKDIAPFLKKERQ